jgi:hypothetical protein
VYLKTLQQPSRAVRGARNSISSWNVWRNICANHEIRSEVDATFNASSRTLSEPELGADITQGRTAGRPAGWRAGGLLSRCGKLAESITWCPMSHAPSQWPTALEVRLEHWHLPLFCGESPGAPGVPASKRRPLRARSDHVFLHCYSNYFCFWQTLQRQWLRPIWDETSVNPPFVLY